MVKKAINVKAKASFKPLFGTRNIDFRCPKKYRPLVNKYKNNIYWEHCKEVSNRVKKKTKSPNCSFVNQPQTQESNFKKRQGSWRGAHLATEVNATKITKKDRDKVTDLSYIKYYIDK